QKILVNLPTEEARCQILTHAAKKSDQKCDMMDDQFRMLAQRTRLFSGSDLLSLVQNANRHPLIVLRQATHFVLNVETRRWSPCSSNTAGAKQRALNDFPPDVLECPPLRYEDFEYALKRCKPTCTEEKLRIYSQEQARLQS